MLLYNRRGYILYIYNKSSFYTVHALGNWSFDLPSLSLLHQTNKQTIELILSENVAKVWSEKLEKTNNKHSIKYWLY